MKTADIEIGQEYAYTNGTGRYDRTVKRARKVRVRAVKLQHRPRSYGNRKWDGVRVKFLADDGSRWDRQKKGDIEIVSSRNIWRPWAEVASEVAAEKKLAAERVAKIEAKEVRLDALYARLRALNQSQAVDWDRDSDSTIVKLDIGDLEELVSLVEAAEARA